MEVVASTEVLLILSVFCFALAASPCINVVCASMLLQHCSSHYALNSFFAFLLRCSLPCGVAGPGVSTDKLSPATGLPATRSDAGTSCRGYAKRRYRFHCMVLPLSTGTLLAFCCCCVASPHMMRRAQGARDRNEWVLLVAVSLQLRFHLFMAPMVIAAAGAGFSATKAI